MRSILFLTLLLFSTGCNNTRSDIGTERNSLGLDTSANTYSVTTEDPSMNSAIAKARKTLSRFDQALESKSPQYRDFAVKKRYKTDDDGGEHMWIAVTSVVDDVYKGYVNNNAEKTKEVRYGDTVLVRKNEITDWMYLDNNILRGGYTIREIRDNLTTDERIKMDKDLGFKIEE